MIGSKLAIDGGRPLRAEPFAPWPFFEQDEIQAAQQTLQSGRVNYWTGQEGRLFEDEFAAAMGTGYSVALANGTLALEAALIGLDLQPGQEVVTTCRTFIASASCVVMRGGVPVLSDVDRDSQNATDRTIAEVLSPRTVGIIAVHLAGHPCNMDPILELAGRKGLWVVEDCAQAHGATYKGRKVGSMGDVGVFSFCQDKIMTTAGEGGMVVTSKPDIWERIWSYKDHGKSFDAVYHREHPPGFRWLHESFGSNWRMTEFQSAVGRIQLRKLPLWLEIRRRNAAILAEGLAGLPGLRTPKPPREVDHAWYKFYSFVRPDMLRPGWSRDQIMKAVQAEGVPCLSGSCPDIARENAFLSQDVDQHFDSRPVARELGENSLMFLVHPTLGQEDMEDTVQAVTKVMRLATR